MSQSCLPGNPLIFHFSVTDYDPKQSNGGIPGSPATIEAFTNFTHTLDKRLQRAGVYFLKPKNFRRKHVDALVNQISTDVQQHKLTPGSAKNFYAHLRKFLKAIRKPQLLLESNRDLGLTVQPATANKAFALTSDILNRIPCPFIKTSLQLIYHFGMWKTEAIQIHPHQADRGQEIILLASWCRGGNGRAIPVRTPMQRALIQRAKFLATFTKDHSLIPAGLYDKHLHTFDKQCRKAGIKSPHHGLRQGYTQKRYYELLGFPCPLLEGPALVDLSDEQQGMVYQALRKICQEIGHKYPARTPYLGL